MFPNYSSRDAACQAFSDFVLSAYGTRTYDKNRRARHPSEEGELLRLHAEHRINFAVIIIA